jgi:hypothetical protein
MAAAATTPSIDVDAAHALTECRRKLSATLGGDGNECPIDSRRRRSTSAVLAVDPNTCSLIVRWRRPNGNVVLDSACRPIMRPPATDDERRAVRAELLRRAAGTHVRVNELVGAAAAPGACCLLCFEEFASRLVVKRRLELARLCANDHDARCPATAVGGTMCLSCIADALAADYVAVGANAAARCPLCRTPVVEFDVERIVVCGDSDERCHVESDRMIE